MRIWQADFYRRPLRDANGQMLWELLICDETRTFTYDASCPQEFAKVGWVVSQLQKASGGIGLPDVIKVFRPQALSLLNWAGDQLGVTVEATRRTPALKQWLQEKALQYPRLENYSGEAYYPLSLDQPPPVTLPENLWGEKWRFVTIAAGNLKGAFVERPIPIVEMPEYLLPLNLGLSSTVPIPGVVIDGGQKSMQLARWLKDNKPVALNYIAGPPDGLILEAGLADRWVVATFEDEEVADAAQMYEQRKQQSGGLHFLLVQPDDSGMTYTGFWLLRQE
jgi:hypothetical protein